MRMHTAVATLLFVSLVIHDQTSPAEARNAGHPNHGVCDPLRAPGTTPGLYGLCVAYCGGLCPEGPVSPSRQCQAAGPKVLASYNKQKNATDPAMPCVPVGCPCWSQAEIAGIGFSYSPHSVTLQADAFDTTVLKSLSENRVATNEFPYGAFKVAAVNHYGGDSNDCSYFDADFAPGAPEGIFRSETITTAQADVCEAQLDAQVDALMSVGVPIFCFGTLCPF